MPTALRLLLYTATVCVSLLWFMSYQELPAAQQSVAEHQQTAAQRWAAESMAELAQKTAGNPEPPPTRHVRAAFGRTMHMIPDRLTAGYLPSAINGAQGSVPGPFLS
jgi:citrate synthase